MKMHTGTPPARLQTQPGSEAFITLLVFSRAQGFRFGVFHAARQAWRVVGAAQDGDVTHWAELRPPVDESEVPFDPHNNAPYCVEPFKDGWEVLDCRRDVVASLPDEKSARIVFDELETLAEDRDEARAGRTRFGALLQDLVAAARRVVASHPTVPRELAEASDRAEDALRKEESRG